MNRGAQLLKEFFEARDRGASIALSRRLGVDPSVVSHWISGRRTPSVEHRKVLEDECSIGWRTWEQAPVKAAGAIEDDEPASDRKAPKGEPPVKAAAS